VLAEIVDFQSLLKTLFLTSETCYRSIDSKSEPGELLEWDVSSQPNKISAIHSGITEPIQVAGAHFP